MADLSIGGAFKPDAIYDMKGGGFIGATMIGMNLLRRILRLFLPTPFKLQADQSGALCLFDSPTGGTFVLPKPDVGLTYDFAVTTPLTSGMNVVQTDAPSTYLVGAIVSSHDGATPSATAGPKSFKGTGTQTKLALNGTTTGTSGTFTATCVTPTKWLVTGTLEASGTIATPFAV